MTVSVFIGILIGVAAVYYFRRRKEQKDAGKKDIV